MGWVFQIISNRFWEVMQPQNTTLSEFALGIEAAQIVVFCSFDSVSYIVQTILDSPNAIGL
jgi:hypothetical protein